MTHRIDVLRFGCNLKMSSELKRVCTLVERNAAAPARRNDMLKLHGVAYVAKRPKTAPPPAPKAQQHATQNFSCPRPSLSRRIPAADNRPPHI